jgi:hypothetical protein
MVFHRWALAAAAIFAHAAARELRWTPLSEHMDRLEAPLKRLQEKPWLKQSIPDYLADKPTPQPPTRDQDNGRCAMAALPDVINLAPKETNFFWRHGLWVNKQGVQLGSWYETRFRLDYTNVDYFVDQKPWFTAQVLKNPIKELESMLIELPPPRKTFYEDPKDWHTVVYKDCENTPMYVSRELGLNTGDFEIFNQLGQLVATGSGTDLVPGQIYFRDLKGQPFAIAGSPSIHQAVAPNPEVEEVQWKPDHQAWDFDHWQVWYLSGWEDCTYLKEPDNRWVIAAVVQEHAILSILQEDSVSSIPFVAFLISCVVACFAGVGICCFACSRIFFLVYPSKKQSTENPFMTIDIGGHPYGSFALAHQKRMT